MEHPPLARLCRRQPHEIRGPSLVDRQERLEHRRDQHRAAIVRFGQSLELVRVGLAVDLEVDGLAQRAAAPGGMAELLGQPGHQLARAELPAVGCDLGLDRLAQGEVREQRDDVGERLVEGETVDAGRLGVAAVKTVENGVRGLVHHHVVRQRGESPTRAGIARHRTEIAEQQRDLLLAVVGIGFAQRMRIDPEPLDRLVVVALPARRPQDAPSQRTLERADRLHRHREDHLLVEARVPFGRGQPVLSEQVGVVEVDGIVELSADRIDIDHFEIVVDRSGPEFVLLALDFPGEIDRRHVDPGGIDPGRSLRIERIDPKLADRRTKIVLAGHRKHPPESGARLSIRSSIAMDDNSACWPGCLTTAQFDCGFFPAPMCRL